MKRNNKIITVIVIVLLVGLAIGGYLIFNNTKEDNQIKDIYISTKPLELEYEIGEELNINGLIVHAVQKNGKTFVIDNSDLIITGFDSSKANEQIIKVEYQEYKTYFYVTIKEKPKPAVFLVSIELEKLPDKLTYKVGEWLDTTGGVILITYSDGSTSRSSLVNNEVYGWTSETSNTPGTYTLTVKYVEKGILAEATFTVVVE